MLITQISQYIMNKTLFQRIYSFFGFWSYTTSYYGMPQEVYTVVRGHLRRRELLTLDDLISLSDKRINARHKPVHITTRTWYWCCLPWFKYYRKFDLFSYRIDE